MYNERRKDQWFDSRRSVGLTLLMILFSLSLSLFLSLSFSIRLWLSVSTSPCAPRTNLFIVLLHRRSRTWNVDRFVFRRVIELMCMPSIDVFAHSCFFLLPLPFSFLSFIITTNTTTTPFHFHYCVRNMRFLLFLELIRHEKEEMEACRTYKCHLFLSFFFRYSRNFILQCDINVILIVIIFFFFFVDVIVVLAYCLAK